MDPSDAINRLTEREKQVLRAWLGHKTAKQIALDLGISHHAVEKRLKMARTKLDVASSLDAARMLADVEGYGPTVAQTPEVPNGSARSQKWLTRSRKLGVATMSILIAAVIVLSMQSEGETVAPSPTWVTTEKVDPKDGSVTRETREVETRAISSCEAGAILSDTFSKFDKDHSGSMELKELEQLGNREQAGESGDEGSATFWMARLDLNRDNLVSHDEYLGYMLPYILLSGWPKDAPMPDTSYCPA